MGKKQKLYHLRANISVEAERIKYLLKNVIYKSENDIERNILAEMALEKSEKISKMSEKIGIILKH
jgi:ribosomal protein L20